MPFSIVRNDIISMQADAIVNTANPHALVGAGVDGAIHEKAGEELLEARKKIGEIPVGQAAVTPAFGLDARYVIHTVGPVWQGGGCHEKELLQACYENSLRLAAEHQCSSIAFPLISAGTYGFPKDLALQTAVSAISSFLLHHEMTVYLVVFDRKAYSLSERLFSAVESYIDENYVAEHEDAEYASRRYSRRRILTAEMEADAIPETCCAPPPPVLADSVTCAAEEAPYSAEDAAPAAEAAAVRGRKLEDLISEVEDTFSEALLRMIDARGLTDPQVYKKANIDRKHFSKIRSNRNYQPGKSTALALAIALELNLDETKDFIGRAGFALSHSSIADIIVEYFIVNGNYDIFELNEVLFAFEQPLIGG